MNIDNETTDTYVLDPDTQGGSQVLALLAEGKHPLCPKCHAKLIVALTPDEAKRQRVNPGMRCPVNLAHFQSTAFFR